MEDRAPARLTPSIKAYLERQEMVLIATSDRAGACHASFQTGPPGFVRILDDAALMFPRYDSAGGLPGLDEAAERPRIGLRFVDSFRSDLSAHIGGRARLIEHAAVEAFAALLRRTAGIETIEDRVAGRPMRPVRWVLVDVSEARLERVAPDVVDDDDELSYLLPPAWPDVSPAA